MDLHPSPDEERFRCEVRAWIAAQRPAERTAGQRGAARLAAHV